MSMHIFQMMMKERFKSALKMKEMSVFLSGFISLNSGVFYTLCSSVVPPIHLSLLAHHYSDPRSAVGSQSPWLSGVIFTQRRPLIGSQWCSKDFDGEIETNRLDFTEVVVLCRPALTNYLIGNLILNIQGLFRAVSHLNKVKVKSVWIFVCYICYTPAGYRKQALSKKKNVWCVFLLAITDVLKMLNWTRLDGWGRIFLCASSCFLVLYVFFFYHYRHIFLLTLYQIIVDMSLKISLKQAILYE